MRRKMNTYRLFVGKPEGKIPVGRPRHMWENNIMMDLGETGWTVIDWIGLAQDRDKRRALVTAIMKLQVP
jgi:hypothetical protein